MYTQNIIYGNLFFRILYKRTEKQVKKQSAVKKRFFEEQYIRNLRRIYTFKRTIYILEDKNQSKNHAEEESTKQEQHTYIIRLQHI